MSRRQINRQKTRTAILSAARTLAAASNWQDLTTRQIAKAAQVSYQTLYNYFPSKAEIVRALIVDTYVGPEEAMLAIALNRIYTIRIILRVPCICFSGISCI